MSGAPLPFLASIPDRLLTRRANTNADRNRALDLIRFCEDAGHRPSLADVHEEAARRSFRIPMADLPAHWAEVDAQAARNYRPRSAA